MSELPTRLPNVVLLEQAHASCLAQWVLDNTSNLVRQLPVGVDTDMGTRNPAEGTTQTKAGTW